MKIYLQRDGGPRIKLDPQPDFAVLATPCPECGADPCHVQGTGRRIAADDRTYEADGVCASCSKRIGLIRAETNTLFGLAEDERVLRGPWLVIR
jgi:hypothetical protein